MVVDAVGTGTAGATNRAIGTGATVFRTGVLRMPGRRAGAISTKIGAQNRLGGVGVTNRVQGAPFSPMIPSVAVKTETERAAEAIEAAEKSFADEMGATLDLTAAAKTVLIATITAAIHAAVAEERQQPTWVL